MSLNGVLCLTDDELSGIVRKESIMEIYHVEETVFARGKFANVRRATHKTSQVQYAAKFIKRRRSSLAGIHHEIAVLLRCRNNARVVRLVEVFETHADMVLILEFAAGGELQRIFDQDQCLGEPEARRAMRQILEGLAFLHDRNIAHLDLKPQNLLLTSEDCCEDIKLCDFGVSKILEPGVEVREMLGTPDYVAPEVLNFEPISLASDIWSVGVLTYVLLSGFTPFGSESKQQTYLNISTGNITFEPEHFGDVSKSAIAFIRSTLMREPKKRPTVHDLLKHPWLNPPVPHLPHLVDTLPPSLITPISTPISTPLAQRKPLPPPQTTCYLSSSHLNNHHHTNHVITTATNASVETNATATLMVATSYPAETLETLMITAAYPEAIIVTAGTALYTTDNSSTTVSSAAPSPVRGNTNNSSSSVVTVTSAGVGVGGGGYGNSCLCGQCGAPCRHHAAHHVPVSKTTITVDRGILC